jgi:tripeptide aminopeptidase
MGIQTERLTQTFLDMTKIDSETFSERAMADWLLEKLAALGIRAVEDGAHAQTGGNAGNIFARMEGEAGDEDAVLFSAHMDTVKPGKGRKALLEKDGTIRSDGTTVLGADDQAGIAEILEALQVIREEKLPHRTIELLFTVGEEAYTVGASAFDLRQSRAREAYVLDVSGPVGGASLSEPTLLSFQFRVIGRAAHAGFAPEKGVHAIAIAARAIADTPQGWLDPHTCLNIGTIQGGTATNIVPDQVTLQGEIRSAVHEDALAAYQATERRFRREAERAGGRLEAAMETHLTAYRVPADSAALRRYTAVLEELGIAPQLQESFGGSDNNVFRREGVDGLCIANAMREIHTLQESTSQAEMTACAEIVLRLMLQKEVE